ncbi:hypothetical protein HNY73_006008 [Argiope bruennichi]|uniref:Retroviral polymerase SH3-like domain-containing protein n=1 Tax=Argiope bruennichi TaxID=94029 RepID=A0A8T0FNR2_ARGBR|nr:hypothetical protein HNY73_006008 [Argiope bruennichi]
MFNMRDKKGIMLGYALRTRRYRIWLPNESKIIETINVSFDDDRVQEPKSSGAKLNPRKKSIGSSSESSTESEKESEQPVIPSTPKPDISEREGTSNNNQTSNKVIWERRAVPRKDKSRTDIYYYVQGLKARLHRHKDVEEYCMESYESFSVEMQEGANLILRH